MGAISTLFFIVLSLSLFYDEVAACELQPNRHTEEQIRVINFLSKIERTAFTGVGNKCSPFFQNGEVLAGPVCVSEPNQGYSGFFIQFFDSPNVSFQVLPIGIYGGYHTGFRKVHAWSFSQSHDYKEIEILEMTNNEMTWRYQSTANKFATITLSIDDNQNLVRFHGLVEEENWYGKKEIIFKYACY